MSLKNKISKILTLNRKPLFTMVFVLMVSLYLFGAEAKGAGTTVTADVVAIDQVIVFNRFGAFNPAGMMYALARDVFPKGTPISLQTDINSCAGGGCTAGNVELRHDKRPRPIVLRVNEEDTLEIKFTNLLSPGAITDADNEAPGIQLPDIQSEQPYTRNVGIHVNGMQLLSMSDDGSKVGLANSLVAPGSFAYYKLYAEKEGAYSITSGPNLGGEGNEGALANGLYGAVHVEPDGAEWYRSQVTRDEMNMATKGYPIKEYTAIGQPIIDYDAEYPFDHPYAGKPILKILDGTEIFHSDLHAVITGPLRGNFTGEDTTDPLYPNRNEPFREMTAVFGGEVKMVQAFPDMYDEDTSSIAWALDSVSDGFVINYGSGGVGSEILANRLGVGPTKDCVECKYEEFFLTSWANGDPAMVVDVPATIADTPAELEMLENLKIEKKKLTRAKRRLKRIIARSYSYYIKRIYTRMLKKVEMELNVVEAQIRDPLIATRAFYPDDPGNVLHGYLNDRTKIRHLHFGGEFHIFHLHAHQWSFASSDKGSNYLDSQAIGPGSSFTYEIVFGGGGNRNKTAGDSIFHCHFYPHFAQGMWALWRVHDTFEEGSLMHSDGTVLERGLVDGEITGGGYTTAGDAIPGGTPTPGVIPLPTKAMAPMPGSFVATIDSTDVPHMGYPFFIAGVAGHRPTTPPLDLIEGYDGGIPRHVITGGTNINEAHTQFDFSKDILTAKGIQYPEIGTLEERAAMEFHGPQTGILGSRFHSSYISDVFVLDGINEIGGYEINGLYDQPGAPYADPCRQDTADNGDSSVYGIPRYYASSAIELQIQLNKVGWHYHQSRLQVLDGDVDATLAGTRAPEPLVFRANINDCVDQDFTNRIPSYYEQDDFQVRTPTDTIGQHIHLLKFDVTSSDGSANGWNYEDASLAPQEIEERIHAFGGPGYTPTGFQEPLRSPGKRKIRNRWYIDRGWMGNIFTHDHLSPSTHQQAGYYGTLLVEPEGSTWHDSKTGDRLSFNRPDGGPTSWRADIHDGDHSVREFFLEFSDFYLTYNNYPARIAPVNPPLRVEPGLPFLIESAPVLLPECISSEDPGTFTVNYRSEPLAHRVRDPITNLQAGGMAGDLSYAFSSKFDRADADLNADPAAWPYAGSTASFGALQGDPFTPILNVYPGDYVNIRWQVGANEEGHNFSINGIKWLQQWNSPYSGYVNNQMAGISEYFMSQAKIPAVYAGAEDTHQFDDYLYKTGSSVDSQWNGNWGILRAYKEERADLQVLPNNQTPGNTIADDIYPDEAYPGLTAPERTYEIAAVQAKDVLPDGTLWYNPGKLHDPTALLYVYLDDLEDIDPGEGIIYKLKDNVRIEPLILRACAGDLIKVELTNLLPEVLHGPDKNWLADTADLAGFNSLPMIVEHFNANQIRPSSHVGLHPQLCEYELREGDGMNVGFNDNAGGSLTAGPGETITYTWYAGETEMIGNTYYYTPMEYGATNLQSCDPIKHASKGLVGALIIEPENSAWGEGDKRDKDADGKYTRASATVFNNEDGDGIMEEGEFLFRDFALVMQDDVNMRFFVDGNPDGSPVPTIAGEEDSEDSGMKAINYRSDPVWLRLSIDPAIDTHLTHTEDFTNSFAKIGPDDPVTPIFEAVAGQEVRFRILKPTGHNRNSVFTLHGHVWARHPYATSIGADGRLLPTSITAADNGNTFFHGEQMGMGSMNMFNIVPLHGAGGKNHVTGDYLYRDMVPIHVYNGSWGIFRVKAL